MFWIGWLDIGRILVVVKASACDCLITQSSVPSLKKIKNGWSSVGYFCFIKDTIDELKLELILSLHRTLFLLGSILVNKNGSCWHTIVS